MSGLSAAAAVALGGALGSVLRYFVTAAMVQRAGAGFPYGTLVVNVTGCLLIGAIAELMQTRVVGAGPWVRTFLVVGVLGGYTTFSSYAYETLTLTAERAAGVALFYAAGSVVLGVAAAYAGTVLVRLLPQLGR